METLGSHHTGVGRAARHKHLIRGIKFRKEGLRNPERWILTDVRLNPDERGGVFIPNLGDFFFFFLFVFL